MKKLLPHLLLALLVVGLYAGDSDTLNTPKDSYNFLSLGIGTATKDLNLVQISYNQKLNQNTSFYGLMGLPTLFGLGISWQQNYNHNGWVLSSGVGINPIAQVDWSVYNVGISYQWKLWDSPAYLSTGIHIGAGKIFLDSHIQNDESLGNEIAWEIMPYPIASVDWRLFSEKKKEDKEGWPKLEMIIVLFIGGVILLTSMP